VLVLLEVLLDVAVVLVVLLCCTGPGPPLSVGQGVDVCVVDVSQVHLTQGTGLL
jgi:hypothetical protein